MIKNKTFSRIIAIVVVATMLLQTSTGAFASQIFFESTNKAFSKEISGNSTSFVSTNNIQTAKLSRTENNYLYCGEQFDRTTGLYYLRARYMNPRIGTFITQDAYAGSIFDPVSLHKYLYANANPVTYKDPSGYFTLAEVSVSMSISTTLREAHATAMFSGLLNALHTFMSGGSQGDVLNSFFGGIGAGYLFGGVGKLAQIGPMMKGFMGVYSLGGIGMGYLQAYEDFEKGNQQAGTLMLITSSIGVVGWAKAYFPKDVASKFGSILKDKSGRVGKSVVQNTGKGKNKIKPDENAAGDHTVFKRDNLTDEITNYKTYKVNHRNPTGFDEVLGYDGIGSTHQNKVTGEELMPHIHDKNAIGQVRKPNLDEIPKK